MVKPRDVYVVLGLALIIFLYGWYKGKKTTPSGRVLGAAGETIYHTAQTTATNPLLSTAMAATLSYPAFSIYTFIQKLRQ